MFDTEVLESNEMIIIRNIQFLYTMCCFEDNDHQILKKYFVNIQNTNL
jgi:hypothetical protein